MAQPVSVLKSENVYSDARILGCMLQEQEWCYLSEDSLDEQFKIPMVVVYFYREVQTKYYLEIEMEMGRRKNRC